MTARQPETRGRPVPINEGDRKMINEKAGSGRDRAIEAAAAALHDDECDCPDANEVIWFRAVARIALAAAVPVLLNDLADSIEAELIFEPDEFGPHEDFDKGSNAAAGIAARLVRAAAAGWGE